MPELPEVETIKNELLPWVVGQSFTKVAILDAKLVCGCSAKEVRSRVNRAKGEKPGTPGEVSHLSPIEWQVADYTSQDDRQLAVNPEGVDRYARAVFHLSNGHCLVFRDRRRLGVMWLVDDAHTVVCKLGPEPLDKKLYCGCSGAKIKPASHPDKSSASRPVYPRGNRQYVCR